MIPPGQLGRRCCIPLRTGWPGPVRCGFLVAEGEAAFPEQLSRAGVISGQGASFPAQDIGQARRCFQFRLERPGAGARVLAAQQTITAITDRVMEGLADWQSRPLDPVYAVIFIDAIVRHEAPSDRVEVKGLRRLAVAAAGLKPRAA